ncbi:MAG: hypothetical protein ACLFVC_03400 [Opitutales bacterium]
MNANLARSPAKSNLVLDPAPPFSQAMRLTKQERVSLSVLLLIFILACLGWLIF